MTAWTIINNGNGEMLVAKDGIGYEVSSTGLADSIHAVQWNGSSGEIENKDPETGKMTGNDDIIDMSQFQFAMDAWQTAYNAEQAAIAQELAAQQEAPAV